VFPAGVSGDYFGTLGISTRSSPPSLLGGLISSRTSAGVITPLFSEAVRKVLCGV
jgi:hypothetical protein